LTTPPARRYLARVQDPTAANETLPPPRAPARLVLASASPRRREILTGAGVDFEVRPSAVDEVARPGERPEALVERLAREKALDVAQALGAAAARPVLGADTIVVLDDEVLGKPRDAGHAVAMLGRLTGRTHRVLTGIAIVWSDARTFGGEPVLSRVVTSRVEMRAATAAEIAEYVALGESLDKAGGYALQGGASRFVRAVEGSRTNVIGLPRDETLALLALAGAVRPAATATPG